MNDYNMYKFVGYIKIIISVIVLYTFYINPKNYQLLIMLVIIIMYLNLIRSGLNKKELTVHCIENAMKESVDSFKLTQLSDEEFMKHYKDIYKSNVIRNSVFISITAALLYYPYRQYINIALIIVITLAVICLFIVIENSRLFVKKMERIMLSKDKIKATLEKRNLFDGISLFAKTSKEYQEKYYRMLEDELNKGE